MLLYKSIYKLARSWLEIWQEIAGDKPELTISLRLLKTKEELEILEPLVKNS